LIGVWGGPRREYAAIKFFLYTLLGSVLMLIAILMLYFNSDLRTIARLSNNVPGVNQKGEAKIDWSDLKLSDDVNAQVAKSLNENGKESIHTFNILALAKIGSTPICSIRPSLTGSRCNGGRSCCCLSASR